MLGDQIREVKEILAIAPAPLTRKAKSLWEEAKALHKRRDFDGASKAIDKALAELEKIAR